MELLRFALQCWRLASALIPGQGWDTTGGSGECVHCLRMSFGLHLSELLFYERSSESLDVSSRGRAKRYDVSCRPRYDMYCCGQLFSQTVDQAIGQPVTQTKIVPAWSSVQEDLLHSPTPTTNCLPWLSCGAARTPLPYSEESFLESFLPPPRTCCKSSLRHSTNRTREGRA